MVEQVMHIKLNTESNFVSLFQLKQPKDLSNGLSNTSFNRNIVQSCLNELLRKEVELLKHPSGAPYILNRSTEISISHSGDYYAFQLSSDRVVGVDIQVIGRELGEGKDYYVNMREQNSFEMNEQNLYLIWSAKEAVYKRFKGELAGYKEVMTVVSISDTIQVEINNEITNCGYVVNDGFILVYTLD